MGVVVTLVFGFLPTLAAGKVRPAVVLQPDRAGLPKAGRALSVLVVLVLTAVIGLLVGQILGKLGTGIGVAFVAMAILGLLTLLFRGLVHLLAWLPSFGRISIQLTQRALAGHSGRVASTLLALVVGMFALSSILLMSRTLLNVIRTVMETRLGGEVIAVARSPEASLRLVEAIEGLEGVEGVEHQIVYRARIVAVNGDRNMEAIEEAAYAEAKRRAAEEKGEGKAEPVPEAAEAQEDPEFDGPRFLLRDYLGEFSLDRRSDLGDGEEDRYEIGEGSDLAGGEGGEAEIVLRPDRVAEWLGLTVGDTLTLAFRGEAPSADQAGEEPPSFERTVTIVGRIPTPPEKKFQVNVRERTRAISGDDVVPAGAIPASTPYILDLEDDQIQPALRELSALPEVFAVEVALINSILTSLFSKLAALPLVVAILALFAAGVIIANSVSLAVLERRRQIGIMKAVGLQSGQVLRLLLLENGLVGLAGGLIGCGIGAVGMVLRGVFSEVPGSFPWATLVALVTLSVAIALAATLLTAWGASRERPLVVLRYE
jgi:predicted lysophospholipase L1 biosynthesis ABC-type transport system permease subunit